MRGSKENSRLKGLASRNIQEKENRHQSKHHYTLFARFAVAGHLAGKLQRVVEVLLNKTDTTASYTIGLRYFLHVHLYTDNALVLYHLLAVAVVYRTLYIVIIP